MARSIDAEIVDLIKSSYERAQEIILSNRAAFDKLVQTLLEKEVVEAPEIDAILGLKPAVQEEPPQEKEASSSGKPAQDEPQEEQPKAPKAVQPEAKQAELF